MTISELREKAEQLGVKPGKLRKDDLVHAIQKAEGLTPCYGIPNDFCHQMECCFRNDCCRTTMIVSGAMANDRTHKALVLVTGE